MPKTGKKLSGMKFYFDCKKKQFKLKNTKINYSVCRLKKRE